MTGLPPDLKDRWQPTNAQIEMADALLDSGKINPMTGHLLTNKHAGLWTVDVRLIHLDGVFLTFEGMMAYLRGAARLHHEKTGENVIGGWAIHPAIGEWAVFEDYGSQFPDPKPIEHDDGDCTCRPPGYGGYDFCRQGCDPECPVCT